MNGQRQGMILEKPFKVGDSIAKERAALEGPMTFFPVLDVEAEVTMAMEARNNCEDSMVTRTMKRLGLERYSVIISFLLFG